MIEDLNALFSPFIGEPNDSLTRKQIVEVLHEYAVSKISITDITTPKEIDSNIVTLKYYDPISDKCLLIRLSPGSWSDCGISILGIEE